MTVRSHCTYTLSVVRFHFIAIPEGVPYEQTDVEHAFEFNELDDALTFLVRQVVRGKSLDNDMIVLVFSTLAERVVEGNRYGHHLVTVGGYVPQIGKWSIEELSPKYGGEEHERACLVN